MARVLLQHLSKTFPGPVHAVRDLDLAVADGELVVLVGPSGCGKSTTLRMIAGLDEPSSGEIWLGDRRMNGVAPRDRDVAMVFQNYALYPHMTVYQNMAFGLKMRRTPRSTIERRVHEAATILAIEPLLVRRPAELSGGQRQRVALGRAIVREPQVFLFDEPLSNLDAQLRVEMRAEIARLHRRLKTTMIYVTHDQVEAMTLGERIVVLDHGAVEQIDTPLGIYQRPANRFVAAFMGSPAMNFFAGEVRGGRFHFAGVQSLPLGGTLAEGPATLGVRPEDLLPCADGLSLGTVVLEVVEPLGHETTAHFDFAGSRHVARLPANATVKPGDRLPLAIRPGAYHLFAGDAAGERLQ